MFRRIALFLCLNFLVVLMISLVLSLLNIRPYLSSYGLDYSSLLIFCLLWGFVGATISLLLSRVMAKWMMGVKLISPNETDPDLLFVKQTVEELAKKANLPIPQIGVYASKEVNAFATGPSKKRSLVAVSRGLLQRMQPEEIRGVLAHEMSHIANGDMVTMTLLQGVINAFVMFLARVLASLLSGFGRNRQEGSGGSYMSFVLFTYLFEVIFMLLGSLVVAAYSRYREFRADAGGAKLAGKEAMIEALSSLRVLQEIKDPKEVPAMAAFKISSSKKKGFKSLFATHPPLEERIERLRQNG